MFKFALLSFLTALPAALLALSPTATRANSCAGACCAQCDCSATGICSCERCECRCCDCGQTGVCGCQH